MWQNQWNDFLDAIRTNKPFNQAKRAAHSNLAAIMGRAAMHMGRSVTWDEALASKFEWFPGIDQLTHESEPPIKSDAQGRYLCPCPANGRRFDGSNHQPLMNQIDLNNRNAIVTGGARVASAAPSPNVFSPPALVSRSGMWMRRHSRRLRLKWVRWARCIPPL